MVVNRLLGGSRSRAEPGGRHGWPSAGRMRRARDPARPSGTAFRRGRRSSRLYADWAGLAAAARISASRWPSVAPCPESTTACSHPAERNLSAGSSSPVRASQRPRASPSRARIRTLAPAPGTSWLRMCPSPINVPASATTTSQASAISRPPATAWPCSTATIGSGLVSSRRVNADTVRRNETGVLPASLQGQQMPQVGARAEAGPGAGDQYCMGRCVLFRVGRARR